VRLAARLDGLSHRRGHEHGILGRGDGCVHEHAVAAELHGDGRVGGRADSGVDDDGHPGVLDDGQEVVRIADTESRSDGRGQRHHGHATDLLEALRDDRIVVGVDHDLEVVVDELLRRVECRRDVGVERLLVAEHLELDEVVPVEQLAGEPARAHRRGRIVAARGVRQDRVDVRREMIEQVRLARILPDVRAPDRHGDHLRAARLDRKAGLLEVLVLARAHDEARAVLGAGDDQRLVRGGGHRGLRWRFDSGHIFLAMCGETGDAQPPPIAWTISTRSPLRRRCSEWRLRGTISSLTSTARRLPARSRRSISPLSVSSSSRRRGSPLRMMFMKLAYQRRGPIDTPDDAAPRLSRRPTAIFESRFS